MTNDVHKCPNLNGLAYETVVLSVFGDESSDETKDRVFVVAGLLGSDQQWQSLNTAWNDTTKGKIFHAADCEARRGDFKGMDAEECHRLHRTLTRLLAESNIIGWGAAMDLGAIKRVFPESLSDQSYLSCFLRVVDHFAKQACIPHDTVEFTFDQHPETEYNSALLYQYMMSNPEREGFLLAEKISFASRKYVGIQAADLWARELMNRFDSFIRDNGSIPRPQWHTLHNSNRFHGEFISRFLSYEVLR